MAPDLIHCDGPVHGATGRKWFVTTEQEGCARFTSAHSYPFDVNPMAEYRVYGISHRRSSPARRLGVGADPLYDFYNAPVEPKNLSWLRRWLRLPKSRYKGNFKKDFGFDVDCYVLDNERKTAVISQRGMGKALGLPDHGMALPRFIATKAMAEFAGAEFGDKLTQPIKFQWVGGGAETSKPDEEKASKKPSVFYGYDVTLLIDLCHAILKAEADGKISDRSAHIAKQAHVILNASAKAGIEGLVYALAGYDRTSEEVIAAFKHYVQEEAKKYEKEFPPELYLAWHRLYDIPVLERGRSWYFKHLTLKHIYIPLAKSDGKLLKLLREAKGAGWSKNDKLFQFLNEVGTKALRLHLGRVQEMAEDSPDKTTYEKRITKRFGNQQEFDFGKDFPTQAL